MSERRSEIVLNEPRAALVQAGTSIHERPIAWGNVVLFAVITAITVVAVPLFGLWYGYTALDWALFAFFYVVSGLGITVGYHRLFSHRAFVAHPVVKVALLVAGGWATENSALNWCADHARHHAKVDTDEDPYNARRGFWHSHVGWIFRRDPHRTEKWFAPFRKDPLFVWQDRWYPAIAASGVAIPFVIGWWQGGLIGGIGCFLLAGVARVFVLLNSTFCINSLCHIWGTQPYNQSNSSRDSAWVSLVTLGEGYHNYHHTYSRDYRNGPRWYNFDPSKWLIYSLSVLGLAENLVRAQVSDPRSAQT